MKNPSWDALHKAVAAAPDIADFNAKYKPGENSLRAATLEELSAILGTTALRIGQDIANLPNVGANLSRIVEHEGQHAEACSAVGTSTTGYGIHFFNNPDGRLLMYAYHQHAPIADTLATASIALFPEVPSRHDVVHAHSLGYDVASVALAVKIHNDRNGTNYPVPLSHNPTNATIITRSSRYGDIA